MQTASMIRRNIAESVICEDRFFDDITDIVTNYESEITNDISEGTPDYIATAICANRLFDIFLYQKLFQYDRTDSNRVGIFQALKKHYSYIFAQMENGSDFESKRINTGRIE